MPPAPHPLPQLYERFRPGQQPPPALGPSRDYNVDLVPKFIMVRRCLQTGVLREDWLL